MSSPRFVLTKLLQAVEEPSATTPPAPATSGVAPGVSLIPDLHPDMNAPGMSGLWSFADYLAAYTLGACVLAILLGLLMVALGPRLGFHGAKAIGMGGIIGGVLIGGMVALTTDAVNLTYQKFSS